MLNEIDNIIDNLIAEQADVEMCVTYTDRNSFLAAVVASGTNPQVVEDSYENEEGQQVSFYYDEILYRGYKLRTPVEQ